MMTASIMILSLHLLQVHPLSLSPSSFQVLRGKKDLESEQALRILLGTNTEVINPSASLQETMMDSRL